MKTIKTLNFVFGMLLLGLVTVSFMMGWWTADLYHVLVENEIHNPKDRIAEDQITVYNNSFIINTNLTLQWASYEDTNSMDPTIDKGVNGIEAIPNNQKDLQVGDIISYRYKEMLITHRIIETGYDELGWYCITKGDNNPFLDEKVRWNQVQAVLIAIIY